MSKKMLILAGILEKKEILIFYAASLLAEQKLPAIQ